MPSLWHLPKRAPSVFVQGLALQNRAMNKSSTVHFGVSYRYGEVYMGVWCIISELKHTVNSTFEGVPRLRLKAAGRQAGHGR